MSSHLDIDNIHSQTLNEDMSLTDIENKSGLDIEPWEIENRKRLLHPKIHSCPNSTCSMDNSQTRNIWDH